MKKVLITGAQGMLGQQLVRAFSDYNVLAWDKPELDITDEAAIQEAFDTEKPDVVINAAAYNLVDDAEEEPGTSIAETVNGKAPGLLAAAARSIGAVFVHVSTDYVFGGQVEDAAAQQPFVETDEPAPQSVYAKSKLMGEETTESAGGKWYVIRTSRLYGKPALSAAGKKSFVDLMLTLAADRDKLQVVDEEIASPTYVNDLADQIRVLVDGSETGEYEPGIYHGTNEGSCTWYEFAMKTFQLAGTTIEVEPVPASQFPRPAARPPYSVIKNTKLPQMRSWEDALQDYLSQE